MLRERVSNNIYVFTSELYAQVTAGAIVTSEGAIVIDTLAYPMETREMVHFIEERQNVPVRYVVYTHYHADHTYGAYLFKHAEIVSHARCRELLISRGREALRQAKSSTSMSEVELVIPSVVFDQTPISLHMGGLTLTLSHAPGHSPDSIVCLVEEEGIMFAGDLLMPLPFFTDDSIDNFEVSLKSLFDMPLENIVQGHGEVILRGEIRERIENDLAYLDTVRKKVEQHIKKKKPPEDLREIDIEDCGKSRIPLNGIVQDLHFSNVVTLYEQMTG